MPTKKNKYSTAFSAGSLLLKESEAVINSIQDAEAFMRGVEDVGYDSIPVNSESSKKRYGREIVKRLRSVKDPFFIDAFQDSSRNDKRLILFYAVCKQYQLITDFLLETVLNKWYSLDYEITSEDFKNFLYRQMDKHEELENLAPYTIKKLGMTTMRMLKELGMLKNEKLEKQDYNPTILRHIAQNGDAWFLEVLLLNESERQEILH